MIFESSSQRQQSASIYPCSSLPVLKLSKTGRIEQERGATKQKETERYVTTKEGNTILIFQKEPQIQMLYYLYSYLSTTLNTLPMTNHSVEPVTLTTAQHFN